MKMVKKYDKNTRHSCERLENLENIFQKLRKNAFFRLYAQFLDLGYNEIGEFDEKPKNI